MFKVLANLAFNASWLLLFAASAEAQYLPDHFSTIEGAALSISSADLLANDGQIGTVEIVEQPGFGTLAGFGGEQDPDSWTYKSVAFDDPTPPPSGIEYPGPIGQDHFTYQVVSQGVTSDEVTVTIHLTPPRVPISGRWPTSGCGTAIGRGDTIPVATEIGWFEAETRTFELCDLQAPIEPPAKKLRHRLLENCVSVPVPDVFNDTTGAPVGWQPLVGDWNDNGKDDLALHNPATGTTHFFTLNGPCLGLRYLNTENVGNPGDQITVGDWPGVQEDHFGLLGPCQADSFCPQDGMRWWLELPNNGSVERNPAPEVSARDRVKPLTSDWDNDGDEEVAYWYYKDFAIKHYGADLSLGLVNDLVPHFTYPPAGLEFNTVPGIPFVLRGSTPNFGLYLPQNDLLVLLQSECLDSGCGGLPVQIIVDP